eukprot:2647550-Rhodomonas_salina.4
MAWGNIALRVLYTTAPWLMCAHMSRVVGGGARKLYQAQPAGPREQQSGGRRSVFSGWVSGWVQVSDEFGPEAESHRSERGRAPSTGARVGESAYCAKCRCARDSVLGPGKGYAEGHVRQSCGTDMRYAARQSCGTDVRYAATRRCSSLSRLVLSYNEIGEQGAGYLAGTLSPLSPYENHR